MLATFLFICEKIFAVITPKNSQNDRLYAHPSSKKKDCDKTPTHIISVQSVKASVSGGEVK